MACNVEVLQGENGDMLLQVDGVDVPENVYNRSELLQDVLASEGTATLPITTSALRSWTEYSYGASLSLQSSVHILQVALFLGDEECVRDLSRQISDTVREGVRDQCLEGTSSAMEALACLPMVNSFPVAPDDAASSPLPAVVQELSDTAESPELSRILERLSLEEMVTFPEHLKTIALRVHSPKHCLQLSNTQSPVDGAQEQRTGASLQILHAFLPLFSPVCIESLVLSGCGLQHEHAQVLQCAADALSSVTHLDISRNPLSPQDTADIVKTVTRSSTRFASLVMRSLDFTSHETDQGLADALNISEGWAHVQKVDMSGCNLLAHDYPALLLQCMSVAQQLTCLDLSDLVLIDPIHGCCSPDYLAGIRVSSLQHLGLSVDSAADDVCACLAHLLRSSRSVTSLVLSDIRQVQNSSAIQNGRQLLQSSACLPNLAFLTCCPSLISSSAAGSDAQDDDPPFAKGDALPLQNLTVRYPRIHCSHMRLKEVYELSTQGIPSYPWRQLGALTQLNLEASPSFEDHTAMAACMRSLGILTALKSFSLMSFKLVHRSAEALSESLANLRALTALTLRGTCVVQVKSLYAAPKPNEHPNTAISKIVSLERLSLTGLQCHELPFGKVAWALQELTALTHLDIAYGTSAKGYVPMSERIAIAVGKLPALRELRLDLYNTHGYTKYLTGLTTLTALSLGVKCRLVLVDRRIFTRTSEDSIPTLTTHGDSNSLGDMMGRSELDTGAAKLISDLLCQLTGIQELCVHWPGISDDDCDGLQRGLQALTNLQALIISPVGENSARVLFKSVRHAPLHRGVHLIETDA